MNNLTKIASLPGSGGGCMSALPAEKNETVKVQMKSAYFDDLDWPVIVFLDEEPTPMEEMAQKYLDAHNGLGA